MDLVPFQYPSAWDINEPYWPAQYDQSLGWPSQYDNTLGFPTGDAFSMIPAQMRQDPLMKKTIRNARRIVAPLKKILRADVIDKGDSFEVHAGDSIHIHITMYLHIHVTSQHHIHVFCRSSWCAQR